MTKKDYELIAGVFEYYAYDNDIYTPLIHRMTDTLAEKNPRFNREKFLRACGVENTIQKITIKDLAITRIFGQK